MKIGYVFLGMALQAFLVAVLMQTSSLVSPVQQIITGLLFSCVSLLAFSSKRK